MRYLSFYLIQVALFQRKLVLMKSLTFTSAEAINAVFWFQDGMRWLFMDPKQCLGSGLWHHCRTHGLVHGCGHLKQFLWHSVWLYTVAKTSSWLWFGDFLFHHCIKQAPSVELLTTWFIGFHGKSSIGSRRLPSRPLLVLPTHILHKSSALCGKNCCPVNLILK